MNELLSDILSEGVGDHHGYSMKHVSFLQQRQMASEHQRLIRMLGPEQNRTRSACLVMGQNYSAMKVQVSQGHGACGVIPKTF